MKPANSAVIMNSPSGCGSEMQRSNRPKKYFKILTIISPRPPGMRFTVLLRTMQKLGQRNDRFLTQLCQFATIQ